MNEFMRVIEVEEIIEVNFMCKNLIKVSVNFKLLN